MVGDNLYCSLALPANPEETHHNLTQNRSRNESYIEWTSLKATAMGCLLQGKRWTNNRELSKLLFFHVLTQKQNIHGRYVWATRDSRNEIPWRILGGMWWHNDGGRGGVLRKRALSPIRLKFKVKLFELPLPPCKYVRILFAQMMR